LQYAPAKYCPFPHFVALATTLHWMLDPVGVAHAPPPPLPLVLPLLVLPPLLLLLVLLLLLDEQEPLLQRRDPSHSTLELHDSPADLEAVLEHARNAIERADRTTTRATNISFMERAYGARRMMCAPQMG